MIFISFLNVIHVFQINLNMRNLKKSQYIPRRLLNFYNGQRKLLSTIFLNTGSLTWESQRFTTAPPAIWEHSLVSAPKMTRCRAWLNINHFRRLALSNIFSMMTELWRSLNKAQQSVVLYMMRTLWVLWLFECVFSVLY